MDKIAAGQGSLMADLAIRGARTRALHPAGSVDPDYGWDGIGPPLDPRVHLGRHSRYVRIFGHGPDMQEGTERRDRPAHSGMALSGGQRRRVAASTRAGRVSVRRTHSVMVVDAPLGKRHGPLWYACVLDRPSLDLTARGGSTDAMWTHWQAPKNWRGYKV